ncbi:MAG: Nif3-like dinuclear metal center hexameric protein [Gammaproteobacteria bacterium]|nr:Nif3-like dinuclear metal center hexameric protein [Gammaproteobacteria bacterium]
MVNLFELERYCNRLLDAATFEDYCPNGLQLDAGRHEIGRLATGVTASQALIEAAIDWRADLLLVHHGYFWRGEAQPLVGVKGRRVRTLMQQGLSLMAYHLPLDAHDQLGNNRRLGELLELGPVERIEGQGGLLWRCRLDQPIEAGRLSQRLEAALRRTPLHVGPERKAIRTFIWCTGAAQGSIEQAAVLGADAYISGEISEPTVHLARELGLHYFAAGHHATERYGIEALGRHLGGEFSLETRFFDIPNPV